MGKMRSSNFHLETDFNVKIAGIDLNLLRAYNENSFERIRFALVIDIQESRFAFYLVSVSSTSERDTVKYPQNVG